jgi:hypothetical protein
VETVGDCYVAVTGVPTQRADHAVAMCRFAKDAMRSFQKLSRQLETKLGPDTGDLDLRVGIHSGQVTGGVLRGERSRFQLFGDTMVRFYQPVIGCLQDDAQVSHSPSHRIPRQGWNSRALKERSTCRKKQSIC